MCGSYGLGIAVSLPVGLSPVSDPAELEQLEEWTRLYSGHAKITGARAKNLNPVISGNERVLNFGWWSLPRPGGGPAFNSRVESLLRFWKQPFQHRALLPASWYDEGKMRWTLPDESPFAIAAITSTVEHDGETYLGYSMVTRASVGEATTVVSKRGDSRMPLVLPAPAWDDWLDPERPGNAELVDQVVIASDEISRSMTPVS